MEPLVLDPERAFAGLVVLTAIPVVMFALWAEYFARYIAENLAESPLERLSDADVLRVRIAGVCVFLFQTTLFIGTGDVRRQYPAMAIALFVGSLLIQLWTQVNLEKNLRKSSAEAAAKNAPAKNALAPSRAKDAIGVNSPAQNSTVPPRAKDSPVQIFRAFFWFLFTTMLYLSVMLCFVRFGAFLATTFKLTQGPGAFVVVMSAIVGILSGLGLNFALGPWQLKKMLPMQKLDEGETRTHLESAFRAAGLPVPEIWVIQSDSFKAGTAIISGFAKGRGWFRPGLFVSHSILNLLNAAELIAVVKHEVSHIALKHLRKRLLLSSALVLATAFIGTFAILFINLIWTGSASSICGPAIGLVAFFLTMKTLGDQNRLHELEADLHSVSKLGSSIEDLASALRKLDHLNADVQAPVRSTNAMTGTGHPMTEIRIRILEQRLKNLAAATANAENSENEKKAA